jgi:hypothetical protein
MESLEAMKRETSLDAERIGNGALPLPVPGWYQDRLRCAGDTLHQTLGDLLTIDAGEQNLAGRGVEQTAVQFPGVHVLCLQIFRKLLRQQRDGCTAIGPVLSSEGSPSVPLGSRRALHERPARFRQ